MSDHAWHLRRQDYRSMPWRNGLGVTLEIARHPPAGSDFQWRLSLASVAASGPFSSYPGYRRSVSLLAGQGLRLEIGGQQPLTLESIGATALFCGAAPVHCTLLDGPCSDLSLMVRAPGSIVSVVRLQAAIARLVPLQAGALKALFCIAGESLSAPAPGADAAGTALAALGAHDTLLLGPRCTAVSVQPAPDSPLDLLLLTWTL